MLLALGGCTPSKKQPSKKQPTEKQSAEKQSAEKQPTGKNEPKSPAPAEGQVTKPMDPIAEALRSVEVDDIASISIVLVEIDPSAASPKKETPLDLTSEAKNLLPLLKQSSLVNSGFFGVGTWPSGSFSLSTKSGDKVEFDIYPFGFFFKSSEPPADGTIYHYDSPLKNFWNALKYDNANRIYSEQQYRDLLLGYCKGPDGDSKAFDELVRNFRDPRVVPLIPEYLKRSGDHLGELTRLEKIDDVEAIAAVCRFLYSTDINKARFAADALESWGQISEVEQRAFSLPEEEYPEFGLNKTAFCTHIAHWFAENGRYSDAVKTVRVYGFDNYKISGAFCLLRPLKPVDDPIFADEFAKPTDEQRKEILLLMADLVEHETDQLFVNFLTDLWDAMGAQYDVASETIVPRNPESDEFFRDKATGKLAADAIRKWVGTKEGNE